MSVNVPEKFQQIIGDFITDLRTTYPEYESLWNSLTDISEIYDYCLKKFPVLFFDILYQNDDIFSMTSTTDTFLLPNVDFKILFHTQGISENTKQTIWKYLQLILITVTNEIQDKSQFGDMGNLFHGIDEKDLHSKLTETMKDLTDFFKQMDTENTEETKETEETEDKENTKSFSFEDGFPDMGNLSEHIKKLFDGKIGSLAKELTEELSKEFMEMFSEEDTKLSTMEIVQKLMKDPTKLMELLKRVTAKMEEKMKNGDISQEEIMTEMGEIMKNMKNMGGGKNMKDIMKTVMKKMGPKTGDDNEMEDMINGILGNTDLKNAKLDMNRLNSFNSMQSHKKRMLAKLEKRREMANAIQQLQQQPSPAEQEAIIQSLLANEPQKKSKAKSKR